MAGQFSGADVAQLRALGRRLAQAADDLDASQRVLTGKVAAASAWRGPDATDFRTAWSSSHAQSLRAAGTRLRDAAEAIERNAAEQERTSAADGGTAHGGGAAGTGPGSWFAAPAASSTPPSHASAATNKAWWDALSPAQRAELLADDPAMIGAMDGLPAAVRDEANRARLATERARLEGELTTAAPARRAEVLQALGALDNIESSLRYLADRGDTGQLLLLDTSGDPVKAAIGVGDVDHAANVAVFTPGIDSRPDRNMDAYVQDMALLRDESIVQMRQHGQSGDTATIAWLGYEAPAGLSSGLVATAQEASDARFAVAGARDLAHFGDGLAAANPDARLSALGHSYGSFTTGLAVQQTSAFDAMAVFGSPGLGTQDADAFHVPADERFVLEARKDAVADLAAFGRDPNRLAGMTHLSTEATAGMSASSGHSEYLANRSTSQYNLAAVVTGNSAVIGTSDDAGVGDYLRSTAGLPADIVGGGLRGGIETARDWGEVGHSLAGDPGEILATAAGAGLGYVAGATDAAVDGVVDVAEAVTDVAGDAWDAATSWRPW